MHFILPARLWLDHLSDNSNLILQRRDDNVPVLMTKSLKEVKEIVAAKVEEVRRSASPNPIAGTLLQHNN